MKIKCQQETSESFLKLLFQFEKRTKYGRNKTMKKKYPQKKKDKKEEIRGTKATVCQKHSALF